jgi:hypothetical protein
MFCVCSYSKLNGQIRGNFESSTSFVTYVDMSLGSSVRSIFIAHDIVFNEMMPRRQPLILNSVFISALCLGLPYLGDYDRQGWRLSSSLNSAMAILEHLGAQNPQALHYQKIFRLLRDATVQHTRRRDDKFLQQAAN